MKKLFKVLLILLTVLSCGTVYAASYNEFKSFTGNV